MPTVGLFIPCYVDQLYPQVGMATVKLLEKLGCEIAYPEQQTCCGQPMANTGCINETRPLAQRFVEIFKQYEYVVCPSGSCTAMVRCHYAEFFTDEKSKADYELVRDKTFELCEFLTSVLKVDSISGSFPHQVGLHQSCHGLRDLRLGSSSERVEESYSQARSLLEQIDGIQLSELSRADECCGFGGTFAVSEEAVSCMMGKDRIADHGQAGTEVLTAVDMSCLMHLDGLIRRDGTPMRVMHIAEILAEVV